MNAVVYMISGSPNNASEQRSGRIDIPALTASYRPAVRPGMSEFHSVWTPSTVSTPSSPKIASFSLIVAPVSSPPSS
jgi:hypothetical protein